MQYKISEEIDPNWKAVKTVDTKSTFGFQDTDEREFKISSMLGGYRSATSEIVYATPKEQEGVTPDEIVNGIDDSTAGLTSTPEIVQGFQVFAEAKNSLSLLWLKQQKGKAGYTNTLSGDYIY